MFYTNRNWSSKRILVLWEIEWLWNWINNSTVNFIKAVYKHLTISLISQVNVEF